MKNKTIKLSLDISEDVLRAIDSPHEDAYYEEDCITDYKQKPYQVFVFVRRFGTKKSKNGKLYFYMNRTVEEISGNTHKVISQKLDALTAKCEDRVPPNVDITWTPEKWAEVKKALKVFKLSQSK